MVLLPAKDFTQKPRNSRGEMAHRPYTKGTQTAHHKGKAEVSTMLMLRTQRKAGPHAQGMTFVRQMRVPMISQGMLNEQKALGCSVIEVLPISIIVRKEYAKDIHQTSRKVPAATAQSIT